MKAECVVLLLMLYQPVVTPNLIQMKNSAAKDLTKFVDFA
jgi:hypothetical protein